MRMSQNTLSTKMCMSGNALTNCNVEKNTLRTKSSNVGKCTNYKHGNFETYTKYQTNCNVEKCIKYKNCNVENALSTIIVMLKNALCTEIVMLKNALSTKTRMLKTILVQKVHVEKYTKYNK